MRCRALRRLTRACATHPVVRTRVAAAMRPSYSDAAIFSNLEVVLYFVLVIENMLSCVAFSDARTKERRTADPIDSYNIESRHIR